MALIDVNIVMISKENQSAVGASQFIVVMEEVFLGHGFSPLLFRSLYLYYNIYSGKVKNFFSKIKFYFSIDNLTNICYNKDGGRGPLLQNARAIKIP